ncbi:unnamed protein product [Candidula unifasciata]|uniref:Piwi n=1 Tax=Candidula unifasciata TaxID=100452 RepID=A0A8S4A2L7_9EUPU|nr:unnamed protein product [Candidula unifasciata]
MSDEPVSGRARGRGGRGRGKPQEQQAPGPTQPPAAQPPREGPGPGPAPSVGRGRSKGPPRQQPPQEAAAPIAAPATIVQVPPAEPSVSGRGVHRGGGRERSHASGDVPTEEMARMGLERTYKRRQPYERYVEAAYKEGDKDPHGSYGSKIELVTNYFRVTLPSEFKIWQYHVNFNPEVESIRVKYALIANLDLVIGTVKCFDGGILYLCKMLPNEVTECFATRSYDNAVIKIEIKRVAEVFSTSPQFIQIVNLLFKKVQMAMGMKLIRDHYFNPTQAVKILKHKLEVMPGFSTSILRYEAGNLLGVDIVHKILRIDTFLDCLYNLYYSVGQQDMQIFRAAAVKQFVGTIVMTRHNNKTYRVDDIDWEGRPTNTFEKGGTPMTYIDYFKERWNITVVDQDQPLLVVKPTERDRRRGEIRRTFICFQSCLSEEVRSDFNVMKDLAIHTRIGPDGRLKTLEDFLKQINASQRVKEILSPWQTQLDSKALTIPARQFPAEQLLMKNPKGDLAKITYDIKDADWSRNMRNYKLLNAVNIQQWLLIYPQKLSQPANDLADCLNRVGAGMGMRIAEPTRVELHNDRNDSFLNAIRQNLNQNVQIVVTVAPNNKKDRYDAIKKSCCIENPVPSQVVLQKTLMKKQGLMSVATKIAIQMNCKMGGEVWGVEIPVKGLMIVGIDSYHDSANKGQSVGALVASLNKECTRYYSMTEYHPRGNDALNGLTTLLAVALRKYHDINGFLPQKLVFYRDGVGDGQLEFVYKHEVEQVFAAFTSVGGEGYKPNMAFIIVKKRINTRLFSVDRNQIGNPLPGTLVDSHITKPDWYDFFLVSQSVRQGTVSPTSYNVIYDKTGFQADHMQRLTYKLTHMYFNWQGTIRVPAPCQYAHKLAFLQGQSLHRQFSALLADKLFYL